MKVLEIMLDNIGKPVNLGFRSSFVYCDIVPEDIGAELARLSDYWLNHEIDLLHDAIEVRGSLIVRGVNKYTDREVVRWISRHRSLDNPDPVCPREVIKKIKTSYYSKIKILNKDIAHHKKLLKHLSHSGSVRSKRYILLRPISKPLS